ncbi:cytochrome P450 [Xylariaceae sp. FL1272]|nr:cytochrome P450 [Xylariaceae sp. FL1272]
MTGYSLFIGYGGWQCILYCAFLWVYRLLLHPLSKYPGPLIAQVSDAHCGYLAVKRCLHLQSCKNLQQYGPVLRQSQNRLIFNSNEQPVKSHFYSAAQPDLQHVSLVADKKLHRQKRKLVSGVLADHSLRGFEPVMLQQINVFLKQLLGLNNEPINLTLRCRYLGLDIAGYLGFGFCLGALIAGSIRTNFCMQFPLLAWLRTGVILRSVPSSLRANLFALTNEMIATRVAQPVDAKNDLLATYTRGIDTDVRQLTQSSLWTEALFFFSAGGETVAVTLAAAFFCLSRNRHCYNQLATEIRSTFSADENIYSGPRLTDCRYLHARINETLRMSPPVPCILWREAVPMISHFYPSRLANRGAFVPFSVGTRGCAGKTMAYLEVSLVLAKVLFHVDFDLDLVS